MKDNHIIIKYSKAESEKFTNKLKRLKSEAQKEYVLAYAQSENVNKRIAAAHFNASFDLLLEDSDIRVVKTLAENSVKTAPDLARNFLKHNSMEVRSSAAVALAKHGALTENELCELDVPIVRNLISKRLYLMEIARIYKHGDIKKLLNDELNVMSRRDKIDVKDIRDVLNAHPFRQGDISYEVLDELEEEPVLKFELKEKSEEKKTEEEIVEKMIGNTDVHQPDAAEFESDLLSSILD